MARFNRRRRGRRSFRARRRYKYATRLPMKKRVQHTLEEPGVLLYRGGFELSSDRGSAQMAPLGSMFCKDATDSNDFIDYAALPMLNKISAVTVPTAHIYIGDVKRVWMVTNSSVSNVKYVIYRCRARKDIPSNALTLMSAVLGSTSFDAAEQLPTYSNIQPTTVGATPYDNPILTNLYKVKPVARGVVGPGGTFEFKRKNNIRRLFAKMEDAVYDAATIMHDSKKYSDTYIICFHGQPCAGLNGANDVVTLAATVLEVASYARVTYARVTSSGITTQTRMETTNPFSAPTSALLYTPGNIGASGAAGVQDSVLA